MAATVAPDPFVVLDCGSSGCGGDSEADDIDMPDMPVRPDRARALAFAAMGTEQLPLSLSGSAEAPTLLHMGERYLPFRYKSGGEVVAYVNAATQSIHSAFAMRAALANGTKPEALVQWSDRNDYVTVGMTIAPNTVKKLYVHRLLVAASIGVSHEAMLGLEVDHKNGVRGDNLIANLQLMTKAAHKAKTGRTTVTANMAARTARPDIAAAADAGATPSIAPPTYMRAHGGARPVVRTSKDGGTTFFMSVALAAASVVRSDTAISDACKAEREAYGYTWRYSEKPVIQGLLDAANAREAACRGTGWRGLVLDDGKKCNGYHISYNLVIRVPSGAHFLGKDVQGGRARKFNLQGTQYSTYALGCASWYGPRPPDAVVMHANDCYDNVTVDGLSWGTPKQNMIEAHGRKVTVTDAAGVCTTYPSFGGAAERLGISVRALTQRMGRSDMQSVQINGCKVTCGASRKRHRE